MEKEKCKKVRYATKQFAEADVKRIALISKQPVKPCGAYFCDECIAWHLTSRHSSTLEDLKQENDALKKVVKSLEGRIKDLNNRIENLKYQLKNKPNGNS